MARGKSEAIGGMALDLWALGVRPEPVELRYHIHCADCQRTWWADGKPTTTCSGRTGCGGTHLRPSHGVVGGGGPLDCDVCGAGYGHPCRRPGRL